MSAVINSAHGGTSSQPTGLIGSGLVAQRKGASMVGLRLADLNQHLCTAMFGVVLGECHPPCSVSEKVQVCLLEVSNVSTMCIRDIDELYWI